MGECSTDLSFEVNIFGAVEVDVNELLLMLTQAELAISINGYISRGVLCGCM
jgi:hypothetical protein